MNTIRWFCTGSIAALVAWHAIGCGASEKPQPPPDDAIPAFQETVTPIAAKKMDLPVKVGTMPLAYLVETSGGVRVVDMTMQHALAQTIVPGRSIVSIDENHGVSIGGALFAPGPLPADHRYAVYFESGGFNQENDASQIIERNDPDILRKHNQLSAPGSNARGVSTTVPSPHK